MSDFDGLDGDARRTLALLVSDGVIVTDASVDEPGPRILWVNEAVTHLTGYSREEIIGRSLRMFQSRDTDRAELARIRLALGSAEPVRAELLNRRRDGNEVIIELDITPIHDPSGAHTGFLAILRDVTEQRLSARRFQALVEHSRELVSIIDPDGRVSYISPAVTHILGWTPEQIIGQNSVDFVHLDDARRIADGLQDKSTHTRPNAPVQFRFKHADGSWRWLEATTTNLLAEPAVRGMVVNSHDVTDRKYFEDALHQRLKLEAVGRLASGVAHDFNNLLTVILGCTELAVSTLEPDAVAVGHLAGIAPAVDRAAALTRQLLTLSRQNEITPTRVDINALIAETTTMLQHILPAVSLETSLLDGELGVVIDPDQFRQVLMNLALNANDAMPGGGLITVTSAVGDAPASSPTRPDGPRSSSGRWVVITVSDTGHGVDEDTLKQIFEPFFSTKGPTNGTGLGLAVADGIITRAGGTITAASTPGQGATFTISLPVADDS